MEMSVSVIIPSYNRKKMVWKAIESVSRQLENGEIIVIDDASTDGTSEYIKLLNNEDVLYLYNETNKGAAWSRNRGIKHARGKYIAFNDSDDIWLPNKLEKQIKALENSGADIAFCILKRFDKEGKYIEEFPGDNNIEALSGNIFAKMLERNLIALPTFVAKREVFEELGGFNPNLRALEDYEFFLRATQKYKVAFVNEYLVESYDFGDGINNLEKNAINTTDGLLYILDEFIDEINSLKLEKSCIDQLPVFCSYLSNKEYKKREKHITKYVDRKLIEQQRYINILHSEIDELQESIRLLNEECADRDNTIEGLNKECADRDNTIEELNKECADRDNTIEELNKECADRDNTIEELNKECANRDSIIVSLNDMHKIKDDTIDMLNHMHWDKDAVIEHMRDEILQLSELRPVLSIIIPFYNSEKYLHSCLSSAISIDSSELEIICVNDGSTDDSMKIAQDFALRDNRIVILDKINSGYGDSVNKGIIAARGKYIGIVESDDLANPSAFITLINKAKETNADILKGNYSTFVDDVSNAKVFRNLGEVIYNEIISIDEADSLLLTAPAIWSGIYKKEFLVSNSISLLPTPGAAYQDTSFAFDTFVVANSIYLIEDPVIYYRLDNADSSSNSSKKVFAIFNETNKMKAFLSERNLQKYMPILMSSKMQGQAWNYYRYDETSRNRFLIKWHFDARSDYESGCLDKKYWVEDSYTRIERVLFEPFYFANDLPNGEMTEKEQIVELLKNAGPVYIYGAGIRGCKVATELLAMGVKLEGFVVTEICGQQNEIMGLPVLDIQCINREGLIIMGVSDKYKQEIYDILDKSFLTGNCVELTY